MHVNGRTFRNDPTYKEPLPAYPPRLRENPDTRPTSDPRWEHFRASMAAAGFGLHLTASAEQFRLQDGPRFWRLYLLARGEDGH